MQFSIPILVQERPNGAQGEKLYVVRPLFQAQPERQAEKLSRALSKLSESLHAALRELAKQPRQEELAEWTFAPPLEDRHLDLRLELASGSHRCAVFLVGYPALGRRLFFSPQFPELRFEVRPDQTLQEQATAVFTRHFREVEREGQPADLSAFTGKSQVRLTSLEVSVDPVASVRTDIASKLAQIFGRAEKVDGAHELRRTGRTLQSMYPDELARAVGREQEVAEVERWLRSADRRPVLLVGPRQVGKTAIIHEVAWQRAQQAGGNQGKRPIWHLSPMRLISGMSYLGEWENRVQAILDHVCDGERTLYFDDLLGLFAAGQTRASNLNVAQVLKPYLERRAVRVVAEITPEGWRVLRERDRGFAELFQIIPVREPSEAETLRILLAVAAECERTQRCAFDLEALPTMVDLSRRYGVDAAFPGKAVSLLQRVARRRAGETAGRSHVLEEFLQQSGLQVAMLDARAAMPRTAILAALRQGVIGQEHALASFADALVTLKARLNDPRRPLGTFLLLGPTGVGKTQAARTLATYVFGSAERLLRFDMNEYVDGATAARLTGTTREPEGLLTSAIRRQPFSVVLFDEIEKAAPEVFDLLLAVLDEGRLTDSLGRVADFTQSVIILTSNLGAREARSPLGFGVAEASVDQEDAIYTGAAEKFFRPEFFNRIDRLIPFRALRREELEGIARRLVDDVLQREGLRRRQCLLSVAPAAMSRLVALGHHPQLGARALKRVIEREVAQPMAMHLANLAPGVPSMASLTVREDAFVLQWRDLAPVPRATGWDLGEATGPESLPAAHRASIWEKAQRAWLRQESTIAADAPRGRVQLERLTPQQKRYYVCQEQLSKVQRFLKALAQAGPGGRVGDEHATSMRVRQPRGLGKKIMGATRPSQRELHVAHVKSHFDDWQQSQEDGAEASLERLVRELAWSEALADSSVDDAPFLLVLRALAWPDALWASAWMRGYAAALGLLGATTCTVLVKTPGKEGALGQALLGQPGSRTMGAYVQGSQLRRLFPTSPSTLLVRDHHGRLGLVLLTVEEVSNLEAARKRWRALDASLETLAPDDFGPVTHQFTEGRGLEDYRTGLHLPTEPTPEQMRDLLLAGLPLPAEFGEL